MDKLGKIDKFDKQIYKNYVPGVPTSFGQEFSKKSQNFEKSEKKKNCESLFTFQRSSADLTSI